MTPVWTAALFGLLSAVSLPLGAALGLWWKPSARWSATLMAFGGGALLAAVTLELAVESLERAGLAPLAFGFVAGAVLFMGLNRALNGHGGFLRKLSTTTRYLVETKRRDAAALLRRLARAPVIRALPPSEIQAVLPLATPFSYEAGTTIFEIGDPGDSMYVIEDGLVEIVHSEAEGALGSLGPGEIFGEMALVTGAARSATARAGSDVSGWSFHKRDFDRLLDASPKMREAVDEAFRERTANLRQRELVSSEVADAWTRDAEAFLEQARVPITNADVEQAQSTHGNASLAIWLGILLDGIPESLVIGATAVSRDGVSMTLIAGVFLANFPEALSSSVGMSRHGYSTKKILGMWTSLMILTGAGAAFGSLIGGQVSPTLFAIIEATAGGAMLAMIAETMLPEASDLGGPATGLMTVLGFLAAICISHLEH